MLQYFVTSLIIYADRFSGVFFLCAEKWRKLPDVDKIYRFIGGKRTYGKMGLYVQRR